MLQYSKQTSTAMSKAVLGSCLAFLLTFSPCVLTPEVRREFSIVAGLLTLLPDASVFPKMSVTCHACIAKKATYSCGTVGDSHPAHIPCAFTFPINRRKSNHNSAAKLYRKYETTKKTEINYPLAHKKRTESRSFVCIIPRHIKQY